MGEVVTINKKKLECVHVSNGAHAGHVVVATFSRVLSTNELKFIEDTLKRISSLDIK